MTRRYAAHPTTYSAVRFRSRLEARWAAFFDLIAWAWAYEPVDFEDWTPDFRVAFPCGHSECPPRHQFWAEVKPYLSLAEFDGHPATKDMYGDQYGLNGVMLLGLDPSIARVEFTHGAGGGELIGWEIFDWGDYPHFEGTSHRCWDLAGNAVQWQGRKTP